MKKIILPGLFYVACFAVVTSCSKQVKAPANAQTATTTAKNTTTTTSTTTQNQSPQGHTCGGSNPGNSSNNSGGY